MPTSDLNLGGFRVQGMGLTVAGSVLMIFRRHLPLHFLLRPHSPIATMMTTDYEDYVYKTTVCCYVSCAMFRTLTGMRKKEPNE